MNTFHLEVVTPDRTPFSGEAERLLVNTTEGYVEILHNHIAYLATVATGKAKITVNGKARLAAVSGGFVSVKKNEVKLVATTFEFADEIDLERARLAKVHAEEALRASKDAEETALAQARLMRALSRLSVVEK